jgi:cytochrome c-type biogenesis protein CcmF
VPTLLSLLLSLIISIWGDINFTKHGAGFLGAIHLAIFASVYTIFANASYIWVGLKGNLKTAGASVAHVGFGMMLLGILIASAKKEVLSRNNGILLNFGKDSKEKPMENATLIKGLKTDMGSYWATYEHNDSLTNFGNINYFKINFESKKDGDKFTLYPNLIRNTKGQEGFSNNPDAKHYLTKDIFTYISYASTIDREKDTATYKPYAVKLNDTIFYSTGFMVLNKVTVNPNNEKYKYTEADTALMAELKITSYDSAGYMARPVYAVKNAQVTVLPDTVFSQNLAIAFTKVLNEKEIELQVKESGQMIPFVSLKVYEFPQINVLWLGTIVMIIGFVMSMWRRVQQYRAA